METFSWLHLTDLHRGMSQQGWMWPNIEQSFYEDLGTIVERVGKIHVILFTGDLVQTGRGAEFRRFGDIIERVYSRLNSLGSNPVLLSVPGNHDLFRPNESDAIRELEEWERSSSFRSTFWQTSHGTLRKMVARAFRPYTLWERRHEFPRPSVIRRGLLPGDFAAVVEVGQLRIGIVGLNTTFLQVTGGNYERRLAVHPLQLSAVCGQHYNDWFAKNSFNLLLTHQPPSWLDSKSADDFYAEMVIPSRFVGHLCGHLHQSRIHEQRVGGQQGLTLWQGCSLFGLEFLSNGVERRHGYSVGLATVEGVKGTVRLWPRRAEKHQAGHWHFVADPSVTVADDHGMRPEVFTPGIVERTSKVAPFSILILSTNVDLQSTRIAIADHLRRSLGVEVAEGEDVREINRFDLVFLLQGWWWDSGRVVERWKSATPEKRISLLVDEKSDWPPHRMIEISSYADLKQNRISLDASQTFLKPEQLPELVSGIVTRKLEERKGSETLGLTLWERAYLEFRIPAWRAGRTALSQPHLFDAEESKELYQPDLYTSLDGTSPNWRSSPEGDPWKTPSRNKRSKIALGNEMPIRIRLGKWLTIPELPRIALIGAPGGGKTIFITRVAAAIATSCLGRPVEFEPDLDVEKLRRSGTLPIPVVLEATRMATRDCSRVSALVDAIADEMSAATSSARPDSVQIESGLKKGRYLLLLDALDEVADASRRAQVLSLLKGIAGESMFPLTRVLLTTRSARYTGKLRFSPELESVEIAPLDATQVQKLCANWSRHRQRDDEYLSLLRTAVLSLADRVGTNQGDQAITENPLMLTAICMVFERYRSLPDDRGRLCDLLIDDLCRSRRSEDPERGWKLDESGKKDLLGRIALAMQEQGAQTWPIGKAIEIAIQLLPTHDPLRQQHAKRHVDWAADHTGILRFQDAKDNEEQIRFWHRLFREYLSANQLAQEDTTAIHKIERLWREKRLIDPFWEDVVRLLPRALGTIEKARSLRLRLESLASEFPAHRGRLLGLAAAAIIENRDLFPDVEPRDMAVGMAKLFDTESQRWPLLDRILFLESLGRLDQQAGDPRLTSEGWVEFKSGGSFVLHRAKDPQTNADILLAWIPVTVQEFNEFRLSDDFYVQDIWDGLPAEALTQRDRNLHARVNSQLRYPNRPVVRIGFFEAVAYTRWKTRRRKDGRVVRLPSLIEWQKLILPTAAWKELSKRSENYIDSESPVNCLDAGLNQPTPVGAFSLKICGACDIVGNVWEWVFPEERSLVELQDISADSQREGNIPVVGGSFATPMTVPVLFTPLNFLLRSYSSIGFRCALAKSDVERNLVKQISDAYCSATGSERAERAATAGE